jgi:hypothetical protein
MRIRWLVAGWALGNAVRRLSQRAGVTDAEAFGALPGDDVIAHPQGGVDPRGDRASGAGADLAVAGADGLWPGRLIHPRLGRPGPRAVPAPAHDPSPRSPNRLLLEFQSLAGGAGGADGAH